MTWSWRCGPSPITLAALFGLTGPGGAQERGTLSGRVTDAAGGNPLQAISISISGTPFGAVTGSDGSYQVSLPAGRNEGRAWLPGYEAVRDTIAGTTLVITNASLVDGAQGAFASRATVVVTDGRIASIATGPVTPPAGAQVIDARGRYLVPGLIDVHTHIASLASARRALESGVTTVRSASVNAFQDVALREAVRRGAIPGPDVVAAGVFVSPSLGETMLADPRLSALAGGVTSESACVNWFA